MPDAVDLTQMGMRQLAVMLFEAFKADPNGTGSEADIIAAIEAEVRRRGLTQSELVAAAPDLFDDEHGWVFGQLRQAGVSPKGPWGATTQPAMPRFRATAAKRW